MHSRDPFLAFCLTITLLSLAGVPPMIGFFAKQQVLLAALQSDFFFVSIIAIFTSVIGAAYYLRIIKFIYFYDETFIPYYISNTLNTNNNYIHTDYKHNNNLDFNNKYTINNNNNNVFIDNNSINNESLPMLPSNSLSLIIALLTNISLFYIIKPYILINAINLMTIPLFLT
jgi:NADH:ubiquinone oxidoreductase subunit 5 (subunit L)/multisubunit Na+/H+ antiporter MnhA subunit